MLLGFALFRFLDRWRNGRFVSPSPAFLRAGAASQAGRGSASLNSSGKLARHLGHRIFRPEAMSARNFNVT
jgi:hypothetical protein